MMNIFNKKIIELPIAYSGICGSDINKYHENIITVKNVHLFGHEIVGVIGNKYYVVNPFSCDEGCNNCDVESNIYCSKCARLGCGITPSGFSNTISINHQSIYLLENIRNPQVGVFTDGIAVVFHAFHLYNKPIKNVCIIGDGAIGLLCSLVLRSQNPDAQIDIPIRTNEKREKISYFNTLEIGMPSIDDIVENQYDLVVECVGGNQTDTLTKAIEIVRPGGGVLVLGAFSNTVYTLKGIRKLFYKQIDLMGSNSFCVKHDDFGLAVSWTIRNEDILFPLLTNEYHISRFSIDNQLVYDCIGHKKLIKGYIHYE